MAEVGRCRTFCPAEEARERSPAVGIEDAQGMNQMMKRYPRITAAGAAPPGPETVRAPDVLLRATELLLTTYASKWSHDKLTEAKEAQVFDYVLDRFRSIRQDFQLQFDALDEAARVASFVPAMRGQCRLTVVLAPPTRGGDAEKFLRDAREGCMGPLLRAHDPEIVSLALLLMTGGDPVETHAWLAHASDAVAEAYTLAQLGLFEPCFALLSRLDLIGRKAAMNGVVSRLTASALDALDAGVRGELSERELERCLGAAMTSHSGWRSWVKSACLRRGMLRLEAEKEGGETRWRVLSPAKRAIPSPAPGDEPVFGHRWRLIRETDESLLLGLTKEL